MASVFASKGCVAKCTFCHRFFKGYVTKEFADVADYIEQLRRDFDIGMILFEEENFGSNRKVTDQIVSYMKTTGLNWAATAVRAKTVDEATMLRWKDAGCVHIQFGIETGSQKMLDVMEKKTRVEDNLRAIGLCYEHDIFTVPGVIVGMPGETEDTIQETIRNLSSVAPSSVDRPVSYYANFIQAVPGTPMYDRSSIDSRSTGLRTWALTKGRRSLSVSR